MSLLLIGSLEQGLLFGVMALGVFISFRVLRLADLTVEGSFPLGGAIAATLVVSGLHPLIAILAAAVGGALAGLSTGLLLTKAKIAPLLAGIITMTALYSINLRVMGRPNTPLIGQPTLFNLWHGALGENFGALVLAVGIVSMLLLLLNSLLYSTWGASLRATGDNEAMVQSLGIDAEKMKILGLCLANALVACSGGLIAEYQGFADIGMGVGTVVAGLASVIIGEALLGGFVIWRALLAVIGGSIAYRLIILVALQVGFAPTDLKLITAALVVVALSVPRFRGLLTQAGLGR